MDLLIGSPAPQLTSVIVDTGSRLVGFPCTGCEHCGEHLEPAFDFGRSQSARWLQCSVDCASDCDGEQCSYRETYSEGSSISGHWFDDLVELGNSPTENPPVRARMGCHSNENKLFYTQKANGIMGLAPSDDGMGRREPTVLQDLFRDKAHISTQIFAMCLATWGGLFTVGGYDSTYHTPGEEIQWTPMRAAHYYIVFPEALALSGAPAGASPAQVVTSGDEFGITIVDSGTTFTYLPGPVHRNLVRSIDDYCASNNGCEATRESEECWRLNDPLGSPTMFPTLRMAFQGGAQFDWLPSGGYLQERGEQGVWCQTFMENSLYQTVLGISWMLHKDVVFDLENGRLGVVRADCPEHHKEADYLRKDELVADALVALRLPARHGQLAQGQLAQPLFLALGLSFLAAAVVTWTAMGRLQLRPRKSIRLHHAEIEGAFATTLSLHCEDSEIDHARAP